MQRLLAAQLSIHARLVSHSSSPGFYCWTFWLQNRLWNQSRLRLPSNPYPPSGWAQNSNYHIFWLMGVLPDAIRPMQWGTIIPMADELSPAMAPIHLRYLGDDLVISPSPKCHEEHLCIVFECLDAHELIIHPMGRIGFNVLYLSTKWAKQNCQEPWQMKLNDRWKSWQPFIEQRFWPGIEPGTQRLSVHFHWARPLGPFKHRSVHLAEWT